MTLPARVWAQLGVSILLANTQISAHVVSRGVGTASLVSIEEETISIEFDLTFSALWGQGEMVKMDIDRDGSVSGDEARVYMLKTWKEKLAPDLDLKVDGTPIPLKLAGTRESNLVGEIGAIPFETFYRLEAELPREVGTSEGEHLLEMFNNTLKKESPFQPTYYIPMSPPSPGMVFNILEPPQLLDMLGPRDVYTMIGRKLVVKFRFQDSPKKRPGDNLEESGITPGGSAAKPGEESSSRPVASGAPVPPVRPQEEKDPFLGEVNQAFKEYHELGIWGKVVLVILAMLYGAAHAFQPGHGKTVVAAYLVGSGGRLSDAIILGLATTFSHTIVVFLAGLGIQLAIHLGTSTSPAALQNRIVVGTSLLSGFLLFLLGMVLFIRRLRFAGNPHAMEHYYHHHHHHQGHEHRRPEELPVRGGRRLSLWTLIGLGTSGGLVPCPAGIMIILIGLFYQKLLFSLFLLVFFSLALGSVLVALGIFFVTGRKFFEGRLNTRLLTYLPSFSALVITGLGIYFMVQTFRVGRFELAAMLESLAGWIRGI